MGRLQCFVAKCVEAHQRRQEHFPAWLRIKFMADVFRNAPAMHVCLGFRFKGKKIVLG